MKIVYKDLDGSAPRVKWQGVTFVDGLAVEVPRDFDAGKIVGNPYFEFQDSPKDGTEPAPQVKPAAIQAPMPRPTPKAGA